MNKRVGLLVIALLVVLAGSVAYAAIPDSQGIIHACRKVNAPDRGLLRVIDSEAGHTCPSGWASLVWNQTGPQGPPGPSSLSLLRVKSSATVSPGTFNQATISCPAGHVATGGGIDITGSDPGGRNSALVERYSGPVFQGTGWTLGMTNTGDAEATFTVEAICAPGSSSTEQ